MFVFRQGIRILVLLVYVDDIILVSDHNFMLQSTKDCLHRQFGIKDLGPLKYFLGIEAATTPQGLVLSQRKYTLDILWEYGKTGAKPSLFPIEQNHQLQTGTDDLADARQYRQLIGKLMYLTVTRPDITYAVNILSQFVGKLSSSHAQAADRVLHYLKATPGQGIILNTDHNFTLMAYYDADWGGCPMTRRSRTKKQSVVARSSAEAEYRAMAVVVSEILWLR